MPTLVVGGLTGPFLITGGLAPGAAPPPPVAYAGPTMLTTLFCTDENIAVRAADDYVSLAVPSNVLARGTDGVFASDPWTLTSASVDFGANGVAAQSIVHISGGSPKFTKGSGELFAVNGVSAGAMTLRRIGQGVGIGQPPGTGGYTGLTFLVLTYTPQIEEITYDLSQRFGIDPANPTRSATSLYDSRELRRMAVLEVLYDRLSFATRTGVGDWAAKLKQVADELDDLRDRTSVRFGRAGNLTPAVGRMGARLSR